MPEHARIAEREGPGVAKDTKQQWNRVADLLDRVRVHRGWTVKTMAERCGISTRYMRALLGAERSSYGEATLAKVEEACGWPADTVMQIANGLPVDEDALVGGIERRVAKLEERVDEQARGNDQIKRMLDELLERLDGDAPR